VQYYTYHAINVKHKQSLISFRYLQNGSLNLIIMRRQTDTAHKTHLSVLITTKKND